MVYCAKCCDAYVQSDHAVLSIRDMFHIVYEMKKKQMAEAQQKRDTLNNGSHEGGTSDRRQDQNANDVANAKMDGACAVADLLDLQSELDTIQNVRPTCFLPCSSPLCDTDTCTGHGSSGASNYALAVRRHRRRHVCRFLW